MNQVSLTHSKGDMSTPEDRFGAIYRTFSFAE